MSKMKIRIAQTADDLLKAFAVRCIVFCEEQGVAYAIERDECDFDATHIVGIIDGEPVAAGRIRFLDGYAKLQRIAVRKAWRGHGYGHDVTDFMIRIAEERGFGVCKMHAQTYLEKFYEQHGFRAEGEVFDEAGIEHVLMVRVKAEG